MACYSTHMIMSNVQACSFRDCSTLFAGCVWHAQNGHAPPGSWESLAGRCLCMPLLVSTGHQPSWQPFSEPSCGSRKSCRPCKRLLGMQDVRCGIQSCRVRLHKTRLSMACSTCLLPRKSHGIDTGRLQKLFHSQPWTLTACNCCSSPGMRPGCSQEPRQSRRLTPGAAHCLGKPPGREEFASPTRRHWPQC